MTWVPFHYREFYDVPRAVLFRLGTELIYLDCTFDDELDDYAPDFAVYLLPTHLEQELTREPRDPRKPGPTWIGLARQGELLGRIPIEQVHFDESRRKLIDSSFINAMRKRQT